MLRRCEGAGAPGDQPELLVVLGLKGWGPREGGEHTGYAIFNRRPEWLLSSRIMRIRSHPKPSLQTPGIQSNGGNGGTPLRSTWNSSGGGLFERHRQASVAHVPVFLAVRQSGIGGRHGSDECLHLDGERLPHLARVFDDQSGLARIQAAAVGMTKHLAESTQ